MQAGALAEIAAVESPGFSEHRTRTRWTACLVVLGIWAGIYLPGQSGRPLNANEARRALPAQTMVRTGDWLTPRLAGKVYIQKPPLHAWAIAAGLNLLGIRSEFAVRFPGALGMLLCSLWFCLLPSRSLGIGRRLTAALMFLTLFGAMQLGHVAEIDGLFAALTGMACLSWLGLFLDGGSGRRLWWAPLPFVIAAAFTKGPVVFYFYYGFALVFLFRASKLRELWTPAHWISVAVYVALGALWFLHIRHALQAAGPGRTWMQEMMLVLNPAKVGGLGTRIRRLLGGLLLFAPWLAVFLIPPGRRRTATADAEGNLLRPLEPAFWGLLLLLSLFPNSKSRYVFPLAAPMALAAAGLLISRPERPGWARLRTGVRRALRILMPAAVIACILLSGFSVVPIPDASGLRRFQAGLSPGWLAAALAFAVGAYLLYRREARGVGLGVGLPETLAGIVLILAAWTGVAAAAATAVIRLRDTPDHWAARIDAVVPAADEITVVNPRKRVFPVYFYLRHRLKYLVAKTSDRIPGSGWLLLYNDDLSRTTLETWRRRSVPFRVACRAPDARRPRLLLIRAGAGRSSRSAGGSRAFREGSTGSPRRDHSKPSRTR